MARTHLEQRPNSAVPAWVGWAMFAICLPYAWFACQAWFLGGGYPAQVLFDWLTSQRMNDVHAIVSFKRYRRLARAALRQLDPLHEARGRLNARIEARLAVAGPRTTPGGRHVNSRLCLAALQGSEAAKRMWRLMLEVGELEPDAEFAERLPGRLALLEREASDHSLYALERAQIRLMNAFLSLCESADEAADRARIALLRAIIDAVEALRRGLAAVVAPQPDSRDLIGESLLPHVLAAGGGPGLFVFRT